MGMTAAERKERRLEVTCTVRMEWSLYEAIERTVEAQRAAYREQGLTRRQAEQLVRRSDVMRQAIIEGLVVLEEVAPGSPE